MIAFMEDVGGESESSNTFRVEREGDWIFINEPIPFTPIGRMALTTEQATNLAVWLLLKVNPNKMKICKMLDELQEGK